MATKLTTTTQEFTAKVRSIKGGNVTVTLFQKKPEGNILAKFNRSYFGKKRIKCGDIFKYKAVTTTKVSITPVPVRKLTKKDEQEITRKIERELGKDDGVDY